MATKVGVTGFAKRISRASDGILSRTSNRIRKAALAGHTVAVVTTPVDTGYARSRWEITIGAPINTVAGVSNPVPIGRSIATSMALAQGHKALSTWKVGQGSIFLNNPTPYLVYLDQGSSQQAPAGISKFAILAIKKELRNANLLRSK